MAWFEAHDTMARHPKTLKLARLLNVERRYAVSLLHDLFSWGLYAAGKDGALEGLTAADIAQALDYPPKKGDAVVLALVAAGYLDEGPGGYAMGYGRSEYGGGRGDYARSEYNGPESRFRDRRGREHYDNGRFAPQNYGGGMEGRYWDGREAYRPMESRYPMTTPYAPPVYRDYGSERGGRPMNTIGFRMSGEPEQRPQEFGREYRSDAGYPGMNETDYRQGGRMSGHGSGSGGRPFDREMAQEWCQRMQNADGTTGPHWTMEQTEAARAQYGVNCDPLAWNVAMNMIYSDYYKVAEKLNVNKMEFYVCMAKAFLEDPDARNQGGEKLAKYYEYVVN